MTEALVEGMSFSKEQKYRLKKLIDENMLTLHPITRMTNEELGKLGFPIGARIELQEEAKNNEFVTVNASLASSFDSIPLIASTSSSSPSPVTSPEMILEKLREAVGHLDPRVNGSIRKDMIHIVCVINWPRLVL